MIDQFYNKIDEDLFSNIDMDLFDNMPFQLECKLPECDKGPGGVTWKTPALSEENALKLLERHETIAHVQQDGRGAGGAGGRSRLAKIPRPTVSGGCSQEEFNFFKSEWDRSVRSSHELILKNSGTNYSPVQMKA